jgi:hypothetical protein
VPGADDVIPGNTARVRPLLQPGDGSELTEPQARPDPRDHRDRGRFLTPRLYPAAPFDPWEPVNESM